ncbi:MAG: DNA replication/repair protein RecF [Bacillota bacterium]|nr:DNA replication/repair protein RecF [Candidatus Fermentithermobacillaceae bacterium]
MRFAYVVLRDFRNYPYLELDIPPGASLFVGPNAQGKTNLLEACYYISSLSSPRAERESDLARWGTGCFSLAARLEDLGSVTTVKIDTAVTPSVRRKLRINDRRVTRRELVALFPCVYFSPDDLYIVKGSSALRRKFLDSILSRQDSVYAKTLQRYNDTVARRNTALKKAGADSSWKSTLESLDELLVNLGSPLLYRRLGLVEELSGYTQSTYKFIANGNCAVAYTSTLGETALDLDEIKAAFRQRLRELGREELARGVTLAGPHRDDLSVSLNGKSFRYFGSQGQQRSVMLALKMAEARCLQRSFGTKPVLLLDDVFSELDSEKKSKVLSLCDFGFQVLMTSTELPKHTGPRFSLFRVENNAAMPWGVGNQS